MRTEQEVTAYPAEAKCRLWQKSCKDNTTERAAKGSCWFCLPEAAPGGFLEVAQPLELSGGCWMPDLHRNRVREWPWIWRLMLNILEMWFRMLNAPFPSFPSAGAEKLPALLFAFVTCSERGQAVRSAAGPGRFGDLGLQPGSCSTAVSSAEEWGWSLPEARSCTRREGNSHRQQRICGCLGTLSVRRSSQCCLWSCAVDPSEAVLTWALCNAETGCYWAIAGLKMPLAPLKSNQ